MRPRFEHVVQAHDLTVRTGLGATLSTLRHLVVDRVIDDERSFRTALLDLRHGVDVIKLLREVARRELLFGVIRWCDDWLRARRPLVACVEAQLAWYAGQPTIVIGVRALPRADAPRPGHAPDLEDDYVIRPPASDPETQPRSGDRP